MSNNGLSGDVAKLAHLITKIEAVARGQLARALRAEFAARTREELRGAFDTRQSPDGARWPSKRDGSAATLVRSGALRDGFSVAPIETGVAVTNAVPYAGVHQHGGRLRRARKKRTKRRLFGASAGRGRLPARPMVPTSRWGPTPTAHLRTAASRIVHRFFHGS